MAETTPGQAEAIGHAAIDLLTIVHEDGTRTWREPVSGADFVDAMTAAIAGAGVEVED